MSRLVRFQPGFALAVLCAALSINAQQPALPNLVTNGQITVNGHAVSYQVRHLPPSSFPDLPDDIAGVLNQRGCLIPQTYEAHQPENVIHGSFQRRGSSDWAMLCSSDGVVSLLVFFASSPAHPITLASAPEVMRLQSHPPTSVLGFNWGIDPASPDTIHDAQIGMSPRPPALDHDAVADSVVDHSTIYHYFAKGAWSILEMPH